MAIRRPAVDTGSKAGKKVRVRARPAWAIKGPISKELANGDHGEEICSELDQLELN